MPVVRIELLEGRTKEQKKMMIEGVTRAMVEATGVEAEKVWVIVSDVARENWGSGGKPKM